MAALGVACAVVLAVFVAGTASAAEVRVMI